jgi:hypothetical protein
MAAGSREQGAGMYQNNNLLNFRNSHTLTFFTLLLSFLFVSPALAEPFDCAHNHCGLLARNNNPDLVIGTIEAVATQEQMKRVFHWAKANGYWKDLPADAHGYFDFVQLVSVAVPTPKGSKSVTVLMTHEEYESGPLAKGALVRYSPHDAAHDAITYPDPAKQSYWVLVGCVAQLCAAEDQACHGHYQMGRYSRHSGVQLQVESGEPVLNGVIIDPQTLLPKSTEQQSAKPANS